jgi:hypothetical protein
MSQNTIPWSTEYLLKWSDFQAEPNPSNYEDSYSLIRYRPTWFVKSDEIEGEIKFGIDDIHLTAEFYPSLSWVRPNQKNIMLLNHEQGHFDLANSLISKLRRDLEEKFDGRKFFVHGKNSEQQKQFAKEQSNSLIYNAVAEWEKFLLLERGKYDSETNFGQNRTKQENYDSKFSKFRLLNP